MAKRMLRESLGHLESKKPTDLGFAENAVRRIRTDTNARRLGQEDALDWHAQEVALELALDLLGGVRLHQGVHAQLVGEREEAAPADLSGARPAAAE